jgi:hypothetical protein
LNAADRPRRERRGVLATPRALSQRKTEPGTPVWGAGLQCSRSRPRTISLMRAWWIYWLAIGLAAALWIGVALVSGRDGLRAWTDHPVGLAILMLPLVVAGLDLILYRTTHEEVCRLEAERHGWLRVLVGRGYSAMTFAWTGVAILGIVVLVLAAKVGGAL